MTGPEPVTMGIGLIIEVPWNASNTKHHLEIRLLGADGQLVELPAPPGAPADAPPATVTISTDFEVGRPPGVAPGSALPFTLAVNVNMVPLPLASRFEWRLEIDGATEPDWHVAFETRPPRTPFGSPTAW